jgi:DNA-binding CsgD family transcriptional regulator
MTRSEINPQRERILFQPHNPRRLSPREIDTLIVFLTITPNTDAAAATRLGISVASAGTYKERLYGKFGVHNITDLAREAIRLGYLSVEDFVKPSLLERQNGNGLLTQPPVDQSSTRRH